jgi:hypothetical protein
LNENPRTRKKFGRKKIRIFLRSLYLTAILFSSPLKKEKKRKKQNLATI